MKYFLISIDTEGDNLWNWKNGDNITTENAKYLPRFQNLCEEFGFKPTYLTNYEMAQSKHFQNFSKVAISKESAEIGMHLHAWNNPPLDYQLKIGPLSGAPYLIEYPLEIMEKKIKVIDNLLSNIYQRKIITHRAGRWAINNNYIKLLSDNGYLFDCSVTPHISWEKSKGGTEASKGIDYTNSSENPFFLNHGSNKILEIPMSIKKSHHIFAPSKKSLRSIGGSLYRCISGQIIWLRPNGRNLNEMKWLINKVSNSNQDYVMFMLHSSELMPGGSPTFKTHLDIEKLYEDINQLFKYISRNYQGATIGDYGMHFMEEEARKLQ